MSPLLASIRRTALPAIALLSMSSVCEASSPPAIMLATSSGQSSLVSANVAAGTSDVPARALRNWILALHGWALPRYERFAVDANAMVVEIDASCSGAQDPVQDIDPARQRWLRVMRDWRELEVLQLGPTLNRRSSKTVDFWPTRPSVIELAVEATATAPLTGPQADEALQRWGSAAKGLPALEWLLFSVNEEQPPIRRSPNHCLYARRIARGVLDEAQLLRDAWALESIRWKDAPADELQRATHDILNLMVGSCELLRGKKLQKGARIVALGGRDSSPTNAYESVRSERTLEFMRVHFEALAQILLGRRAGTLYTRDGARIGLSDLLAQNGRRNLAAPLAPAVSRVHEQLAALPVDPRTWTVENTEPAAQALKDLRTIIDSSIAPYLHVVVTFSDADGD